MDDKRDAKANIIPIRELRVDPAAEDLLDSPAMRPYVDLAMAVMSGVNTETARAAIAALPLEDRYVRRVASALKWAFVDLETLSVEADRESLSPKDRGQLLDSLQHRPLQLCLFLAALVGPQEMERMIVSALTSARQVVTQSQDV